tara:strand:- start:101 stop:925 length:825 start_codon:yes stop_codon:yes gene_type:complete
MGKFALGKHAKGISDRSGFEYLLKDMRKEWNGLLVGKDEWESKQPQLFPRRKALDAEALKDPRPPSNLQQERVIQYGFNPVGYNDNNGLVFNNLTATASVGTVVAVGFGSDSGSVDAVELSSVFATASVSSVIVADSGSTDIATVSGMAAVGSIGSVTVTTSSAIAATYTVTVAAYLGANYFYIDGSRAATLNLSEGSTYRFDQSDSSNSNHPLRFSITSNGTHGGGSEYTTGVTTNGTPGSSGAYSQIEVASGAPTLYYYCTNHSGMGGTINT